ncbi:podocalyxin [Lemur catta]|uniref:podocalyxin n=1 Tax=Lemur catta TaxID=9447 RepID=UPI001E268449|nr:podocalyxin [Lemur catta]
MGARRQAAGPRAPDLAAPPSKRCCGDACGGHLCTGASRPAGAWRPRTRTHPPARGRSPEPGARPRSPSRRAPGRSFLLCSLFATQRPPSPGPARPGRRRRGRAPEGRGTGGEGRRRGGGGGRRGRDGSRRSCRRGRSRADAAQDAAATTALPLAPRPSPALRQLQGGRAAGARLGSPRPPQGRRSHRQASQSGAHAPTTRTHARTFRQPRSHLLPARGEDTMRSALALLLLLLLPPPPSLSQNVTTSSGNSAATTKTMATSQQGAASVPTNAAVTSKIVQQSTVQPSSDTRTIASPVNESTLTVSSSSAGTLPKQASSTVATVNSASPTTTAAGGSAGVKDSASTTLAPPTVSAKPGATSGQGGIQSAAAPGDQSTHRVSTGATTTKEEGQATSQPTDPVTATQATPPLPPAMPTSSPKLTDTTSELPESSPKGQHRPPTASSSSGTTTSPGLTVTPHGMPATLSPAVIEQGTQQTSSQMPAVSTDSSAKAPPQHTSQAPGTATTTPIGEPTSPVPEWPTTAPQGPSTPSPSSAFGKNRIKCDPPEKLSENLLVLNLTRTSLCAGSPPDEKLVTLLCRAAKATFSPAHDECHVVLAPVPESDVVAVKEIMIQTNLLPKDIYEQLKDKWDDLREAGVSHMQLGDQGPPEEAEDRFSTPLIITIVCMASFLLLVAALYGCCHQRLSQRKDQQRLTEELQTVENGYHDNPTLEVMETSSEMQEKKVNLNGELGDSWIVPLDNLTKDDLEEEDTHL